MYIYIYIMHMILYIMVFVTQYFEFHIKRFNHAYMPNGYTLMNILPRIKHYLAPYSKYRLTFV